MTGLMERKAKKIMKFLDYQQFSCSMMVTLNIMEIYYLSIPCNEPILDSNAVYCMHKSKDYYSDLLQRDIDKNYNKGLLQINMNMIAKKPSIYGYVDGDHIRITTFFICDDKTRISVFYLCDGLMDCSDKEDELFCHLFHNLLTPSQTCEMLVNANFKSYELICPQLKMNTINESHHFACRDSVRDLTRLTFDLSNPGFPSFDDQILRNEQCIYIPHPCGFQGGTSNGYHLISCDDHVCDEKHFKCPGFYCLAWRYVCNGLWECPGGMDEKICNRNSCPGMFKCKNSTHCVSMSVTCDFQPDCKFGDDESFCSFSKLSHEFPGCPSNCSCLAFSLSCNNITLDEFADFSMYISIHLNHVVLPKGIKIPITFGQVVFLVLKQCGITKICKEKGENKHTMTADLSINIIQSLTISCFISMSNIYFLNISHNSIRSVARNSFKRSKYIGNLDMSWNLITHLQDYTFSSLPTLLFLNLTANPVISISVSTFSRTSLKSIVADEFKVCCVKPTSETFCSAELPKSDSCGKLLNDVVVKFFILIVSCIGLIMNIGSYLMIKMDLLPSGDSYNNVIMHLSITDILYCSLLLSVVAANEVFGNDYLAYGHQWKASFVCHALSIISIIVNYLSIFTINLLTLARFRVVRNPLGTKFKASNFLTKISSSASIIISLIALTIGLSYFFTTDNHQLPTGICLLIGCHEKALFTYILTCSIILGQVASCIAIPIMYHLIIQGIDKSKFNIGKNVNTGDGQKIKKSIFVAYLHLFCWIPSILLLCMTLLWKNYPYALLVWVTMVIMPLSTIFDPFVFAYFRLCRLFVDKIRRTLTNMTTKKWHGSSIKDTSANPSKTRDRNTV